MHSISHIDDMPITSFSLVSAFFALLCWRELSARLYFALKTAFLLNTMIHSPLFVFEKKN